MLRNTEDLDATEEPYEGKDEGWASLPSCCCNIPTNSNGEVPVTGGTPATANGAAVSRRVAPSSSGAATDNDGAGQQPTTVEKVAANSSRTAADSGRAAANSNRAATDGSRATAASDETGVTGCGTPDEEQGSSFEDSGQGRR